MELETANCSHSALGFFDVWRVSNKLTLMNTRLGPSTTQTCRMIGLRLLLVLHVLGKLVIRVGHWNECLFLADTLLVMGTAQTCRIIGGYETDVLSSAKHVPVWVPRKRVG